MTGGYGKVTYQCEIKYKNGETRGFIIRRKANATPIIEHSVFRIEQEFDLLTACDSRLSFTAPIRVLSMI